MGPLRNGCFPYECGVTLDTLPLPLVRARNQMSPSQSLVLDLTINGVPTTCLDTFHVFSSRFEFCWTAMELGRRYLHAKYSRLLLLSAVDIKGQSPIELSHASSRLARQTFQLKRQILASDSSPKSVMVIFRRQTECKFQLEDMIQTGYAGACT